MPEFVVPGENDASVFPEYFENGRLKPEYRKEFEAELAAEYDQTLADYDRLLDEYKDQGFSTRIKPFYGRKR